MSFDKFQLTLPLLKELYNNSLVLLDSTQASPESLEKPMPPSLGANRKRILILLEGDSPTLLDKDHLQFITDVLQACKLSLDDVILFHVHHPSYSETRVLASAQPERVLLFGSFPFSSHPDVLNPYEIVTSGTMTLMRAPALAVLYHTLSEKKKLWSALKSLFHL